MYLLPLAAVFQDAGRVINGPVVFADRQIGALVLVHLNHQVVILELQLLKCPMGKKEELYTNLLSSDQPR